MSTPVQLILSGLSKHRQSGPGRWLGSCPGPLHKRGDRNMSLSIGETAEGAALLHCFAGCEVAAILAALNLSLSDLYPPNLNEPDHHGGKPKVPPIPWKDIFTAISRDLIAIQLMAADIVNGRRFSDEDLRFFHGRVNDLESQIRRARHG